MAARPRCGQKGQGQRARPKARLENAGAGEDVGGMDDLGGVLGVDDRRSPRHRQHVVGDERAERQETPAFFGLDDGSLLAADELAVAERAPGRLEVAVAGEGDRVLATLGVG